MARGCAAGLARLPRVGAALASGRDSTTCRPFVSGRVGTACQPRSSPPGELGRGKALPCTPDEEGAAKPRPTLKQQLGWHAVPTLPNA